LKLVICNKMKIRNKFNLSLIFFLFSLFLVSACKNKKPSVLKVYVRSSSNELIEGAMVVIVGDQSSDQPTLSYVDTLLTNSSGYAEFNMQPYFDLADEKKNPTGVFGIITKKGMKEGEGTARCRVHLTAVETVNFPN
jgi:hypothetical protein